MAGVRLKTTSNGRGYASLLANGSRQLLSFSSGRQQFFKHKIYCLMLMSCHYYVMYCCRYVYYCKLAFIIKTLLIDWLTLFKHIAKVIEMRGIVLKQCDAFLLLRLCFQTMWCVSLTLAMFCNNVMCMSVTITWATCYIQIEPVQVY